LIKKPSPCCLGEVIEVGSTEVLAFGVVVVPLLLVLTHLFQIVLSILSHTWIVAIRTEDDAQAVLILQICMGSTAAIAQKVPCSIPALTIHGPVGGLSPPGGVTMESGLGLAGKCNGFGSSGCSSIQGEDLG
jgi:hypothetical protein